MIIHYETRCAAQTLTVIMLVLFLSNAPIMLWCSDSLIMPNIMAGIIRWTLFTSKLVRQARIRNAQCASVTRPDDPMLSLPPILTPSEPSACFTFVITTLTGFTATVRLSEDASDRWGIRSRRHPQPGPQGPSTNQSIPFCAIFSTCHFTTGIFPSASTCSTICSQNNFGTVCSWFSFVLDSFLYTFR